MKGSKNQAPSSKKASKPKPGGVSQDRVDYWDLSGSNSEPMILKEESGAGSSSRPPFDLEERTARFGETIVRFSKKIPKGPTNNRLIDQLTGCGTSVGANYCEANEAVSKKDFRYIIGRCLKESKETRFFLRMVAASEPDLADEARCLYREATELLYIFSTMRKR